jgi:hypothetical protein
MHIWPSTRPQVVFYVRRFNVKLIITSISEFSPYLELLNFCTLSQDSECIHIYQFQYKLNKSPLTFLIIVIM